MRAGSGLAMAKTPSRLFRKDPATQGPYGKNPAPREKDRVSITSSTYPRAGACLRGDYTTVKVNTSVAALYTKVSLASVPTRVIW